MLRDILKQDPQVLASARVIAHGDADVMLLTGFDFDLGLVALNAFADLIVDHGTTYPYRFALPPNTGVATGVDLDGNGRLGTPRDAQGYGQFAGDGGMAILSRFPIDVEASRTFSDLLWSDLPGAIAPPGTPDIQRLSTTAHWDVELRTPDGLAFHVWAFHASPPVFDGPEDRNGRRNHDETAFWLRYLDGTVMARASDQPFVLLGTVNLDVIDGDGRPAALQKLLAHPRITDPKPASAGGTAATKTEGGVNLGQTGDPSLDTANWPDVDGPGNLRVDYVLPSTDWTVEGSGTLWPMDDPDSLLSRDVIAASRHRLVWVDLVLKRTGESSQRIGLMEPGQ